MVVVEGWFKDITVLGHHEDRHEIHDGQRKELCLLRLLLVQWVVGVFGELWGVLVSCGGFNGLWGVLVGCGGFGGFWGCFGWVLWVFWVCSMGVLGGFLGYFLVGFRGVFG